MVVTNSIYSRDAIELAAKSPCILVDRAGLVDMINKARAALGCGGFFA
jgi:HJR/Mrr/RecB family endonuclease